MEKIPHQEQPRQAPPAPDIGSETVAVGGSQSLLFLDIKNGSIINLSEASKVGLVSDRLKVHDGGVVHEIKCQNHEAARLVFSWIVDYHLKHNLVFGHPVPNTQTLEKKNENGTNSAVQEEKEGPQYGGAAATKIGNPSGISSSNESAGSDGKSESVSESDEAKHEGSSKLELVK